MEATERDELLARIDRLEKAVRYLVNMPSAVYFGGGGEARLRELRREFPEAETTN